jgi:hypothetical protein
MESACTVSVLRPVHDRCEELNCESRGGAPPQVATPSPRRRTCSSLSQTHSKHASSDKRARTQWRVQALCDCCGVVRRVHATQWRVCAVLCQGGALVRRVHAVQWRVCALCSPMGSCTILIFVLSFLLYLWPVLHHLGSHLVHHRQHLRTSARGTGWSLWCWCSYWCAAHRCARAP